jgi:glycosyltransferase involved in cell wall biosynthesis
MDGDQQNDPRDIPRMLEVMGEGYDVVSGWRKNRQDRAISRKLPSKIANALISRLTGTPLHDYGCTLKAYDSEVVRHLRLYGELHRFIPALAALAGARVVEIPVNHRARTRGSSKYGISRTLRVILDLITVKFLLRYLTRPMQFFGKWGVLSSVIGLGVLVWLIAQKVIAHSALDGRPLLILAAVAFLGGLMLFCTGLLGEVLTRIYHESGNRVSYTVRTVRNRDFVPITSISGSDRATMVNPLGHSSQVTSLTGVTQVEGV